MKTATNLRGAFWSWSSILFGCLAVFGIPVNADPLTGTSNKIKVQPVVPLQVHAFSLQDVRLLPGPFQHAMELDHQYLLELDVDRLLHNFRINAGLPSQAQPLGGWEAPSCELRGHFVGHFLSACAMMYASTGDSRLKEKVNSVVAGLAECQAKLGSGYLSAYPESFIDRVEKRVPVWAPYYTLHKIFAGLLDAYEYCDNAQALEMARKFGDWVIARNSRLSDEQMQAMLRTEHGGMNETLANLYSFTGEEKYLKISLRFNHHLVIDPAEHQEDQLTGLHANTQIPKFIGTARQFELTGEPALKTASIYFWTTVTRERSYVIGGHSDGEMFSPKEHLSRALGRNTTETCNTYNMLKLTRHLFCWDPKAEYADYYERALYNHILASQNPDTGMMCYYVPLRSGSRREYNTPNDSFWCCTGTGVENHAKYTDSIYFHDDLNLFVNLFIASELNWKTKGLKLRQETSFPEGGGSELQFSFDAPVELTLHVRHPFWASAGFEVRVNGERQPAGNTGSYVVIHREWKTGDRVSVKMPFSLRMEAFKDDPNRFAIMNGPLVLCAPVEDSRRIPAIVADDATVLASLKPVPAKANTFTGSEAVFRFPGKDIGTVVTLMPFYQASSQRYVTYWDRFTAEEWKAKQLEFQKDLAAQQALDARTVDSVEAGEEQNERDHNGRGEETDTREFNDRVWRLANTNGWFSWDLKVLPNEPQQLRVEMGGSRGGAALELFVDGTRLSAEHAQGSTAERGPTTNVYVLPSETLKGKEKVTVKFQAPENARGRGVAGVRVLKGASNL